MTASVGGHTDAVRLLIEAGADVLAADQEGLTPLMNAAENGTVPVLQVLVDAANKDPEYLNALSNTGFTALIIASAHGHAEAVDYLLTAGADAEKTAENKVTPLMFAAASNHVDVMKVLLEKGNAQLDARHSNGGTALLEATTGGAVDAIRYLLEKGAQVDFVDDDGVTPLMAIASNGNEEGFDLVLDALKMKMLAEELTKFINKFSYSGGSTVMFATAGGHEAATKKLLELGADINAIAKATPEYLEKLKKLIAEGTVQEEEPHVDGVTALHVAAQAGHLDVVNMVIEAGADVTIKDEEGRTALLLAIKGNYGEVASALVKAGADPNTPYIDDDDVEHNLLFDAIMVENVDFAKLMIEKGADLYYQDEKKVTTLLQASHRGLTDIVKALLDKHAESGKKGFIDDASDEGISPLIAAASEGIQK
jgi:ankyrin repeat protein